MGVKLHRQAALFPEKEPQWPLNRMLGGPETQFGPVHKVRRWNTAELFFIVVTTVPQKCPHVLGCYRTCVGIVLSSRLRPPAAEPLPNHTSYRMPISFHAPVVLPCNLSNSKLVFFCAEPKVLFRLTFWVHESFSCRWLTYKHGQHYRSTKTEIHSHQSLFYNFYNTQQSIICKVGQHLTLHTHTHS